MYNIEFRENNASRKSAYSNIVSLTINVEDINMMQYVDVICDIDKNLRILYLKYLKHCKKNKDNFDSYVILNDKEENEKIISSIIACDWLIYEGTFDFFKEKYQKRRDFYQKEIEVLKDSKKTHDIHQCLLMQYFIDTFDKIQIKEKEYVKTLDNKNM